MMVFDDNHYMRMALRQAEQAYSQGEIPIGCVIVKDDKIIAKAWNQVEMLKDATAHAEILALTQASTALENWRLQDCTVYVTKEPCPMCAGALSNARVKKVVFAVHDERCGGCSGQFNIHQHPGMLHNYEIEGGILEEESLFILQDFFRMRREAAKQFKIANREAGAAESEI